MIEYKDVSLEREQQLLLRDVNLHIGRGEFVYLIGKVGSGKSSLLKSLYAEIPIVDGEARVFEYDLKTLRRSQVPMLRRQLGIIFQDFQLLVDRTVQQNLDFVLKATDWKSEADRNRRIEEVLQLVGMENKGYRMPNTLSGGEQQRIVIARALLNSPSVILADEPTGNLDPETGTNIVQLLYDICHQHNTTVLMSTHNLQLLEQFPGRVLRVEDGRVCEVVDESANAEEPQTEESQQEEAKPEEIQEEGQTPDVQELAPIVIGASEAIVEESVESVTEVDAESPQESTEEVSEDEETSKEEVEEDETQDVVEAESQSETQSETSSEPEDEPIVEPIEEPTEEPAVESSEEPSEVAKEEAVEPEMAIDKTPQSVPIEVVPEETQSDSSQDSDDNNNAESHCSPSDTEPEARNCSERFGQIPSDSAAL